MDLDKLSLFGMIKGKMTWLAQRQTVLAQNIANADTPEYKSKDLKAIDFKQVLTNQQGRLLMTQSNPMHLAGHIPGGTIAAQVTTVSYETAPNGNAVVLEEQMVKMNETQVEHRLTSELYRKHIGMIKIAIGKGR